MSEKSFDIVQAKLSGIYCTVTTEIPFDNYERFVLNAARYLHDRDLNKSAAELMDDQRIMKIYDTQLHSIMTNAAGSVNFYDVDYDVYRAFLVEIQALAKQKEAEKQAAIGAISQNENVIPVGKENYKKAFTILQAAGLIDPMFEQSLNRSECTSVDDQAFDEVDEVSDSTESPITITINK